MVSMAISRKAIKKLSRNMIDNADNVLSDASSYAKKSFTDHIKAGGVTPGMKSNGRATRSVEDVASRLRARGIDVTDSQVARNNFSHAGKKFAKNAMVDPKQIAGSAATGALAGGALGGTVSLAQGESFWEGAADGALMGGIGGAAYTTAHKGFGGNGKLYNRGNPKNSLRTNASRFAFDNNLVSSADVLRRSARDSKTARDNILKNRR